MFFVLGRQRSPWASVLHDEWREENCIKAEDWHHRGGYFCLAGGVCCGRISRLALSWYKASQKLKHYIVRETTGSRTEHECFFSFVKVRTKELESEADMGKLSPSKRVYSGQIRLLKPQYSPAFDNPDSPEFQQVAKDLEGIVSITLHKFTKTFPTCLSCKV